MWRERLLEIKKEKNITTKMWAEASGIPTDTIHRIMAESKSKTDAPRLDTIEALCTGLGVEVWEIFYLGDKSLVSLQGELNVLKEERDSLLCENGILKAKIEALRDKVDTLKDEIIDTHKYYIKKQ